MTKAENELEELKKAIETPDLVEMMNKYKCMVKDWASMVDLKLNNDYIKCPITLYNEVRHVYERLKLINEYQEYIEFCAILQAIIDDEKD
jgi:DNA-binding transcriptional regulator PaaX